MCYEKKILWLIKVHPAEQVLGTRLPTELLLKRHFRNLPQNIRIIPSSSNISTDKVFEQTDFGITLGGTSAIELSASGKFCIVSSSAFYARYGFTIDSSNSGEFLTNLRNLAYLPAMSINQKNLAIQFAHQHFIEDPILINWLHASYKKDQDKYKVPPKINYLSDRKNVAHTIRISENLEQII